LFLLLE